ncbi:glycosyl hydrolase [Planctomycetota bacterium]
MIGKFGFVKKSLVIVALLVLFSASIGDIWAANQDVDLFGNMRWRNIGPSRGGRVTAVTGVADEPMVYYFGATGGGVWKTENAGITWRNVSDGYFKKGSVGAIAVADSNPNVIYVGMGESSLRNDISHGDGIYKSQDGGRTWKHMGLEDTHHTRRIRIHPENPNLVYVTALGHVYGPNEQRGVFRSKDGGATWEKVLFVDDKTGAIDLCMDAKNPNILYAGMWQVLYTPWARTSGGPGSGLYKSTDGGDSWTELTNGLPRGDKGRIGVAVSPVKPSRVWALIEAEDGGLYRSEDAGKTWSFISDYMHLLRRHDYYTHIYADTQDADTVYVLTSPFMKSVDGGRTWRNVRTPHSDNHDLWIAPENNMRMINGNDGGANVSFDGGGSWSRQDNQPTTQLYHVVTDNRFIYRVYGAMQDNGTISVSSRGGGRGGMSDTYSVAGGESGYIAVDPDDPDVTYGGSYWGRLSRYNHRTGERRDISILPELPGGRPGADLKYRFNWTFPIVISPHDSETIYVGAQVLFKSTDQGHSWQKISGDLTRNDEGKMVEGKLTHFYCTIFTVSESPLQKNLIWVGSDDGLVHMTRNGGKQWINVTPDEMPQWSRISIVESSPHRAGKAYLAVNRFDLDDYQPYIYKTNNYGKTWNLITNGIPEDDFVRVVREDPHRSGLLYAGTETGVYISFNDGENWQSLQLNLPAVPVHDLVVKDDDLVIATHGRAFWILEGLTPMRQTTDEVLSSAGYLFPPQTAYRARGFEPVVHYYLKETTREAVKLEFMDAKGNLINTFGGGGAVRSGGPGRGGGAGRSRVSTAAGLNSFSWDMRYPDARGIKGGAYLMGGSLRGPTAVPGTYQVKLTVGDKTITRSFEIKRDPRITTSLSDYQEQFDMLIAIRDTLSAAHDAVNQILDLKEEIDTSTAKIKDLQRAANIKKAGESLKSKLNAVLSELVELRYTGFDDQTLVWPLKLNNRIASLQASAGTDTKPTRQCRDNFAELKVELDVLLKRLDQIMKKDVVAFRNLLK